MYRETLSLEVIDKKIVKLLCNLENSTKDEHLRSEGNRSMATPPNISSVSYVLIVYLSPLFRGDVEFPEIA